MSIISRLSVVLGLDTGQFNSGLGQAEGDLNKFSSTAKTIGVGAVAALGYAFVATAKEALSFADDMTELAQANDMSVASVLELTQALTTSGGKVENAGKLIASFTNKIDEAAQGSQKTRDKFAELGVSLSDIQKLSETDLLRKTISGLSEIEDPVRRNALAFDLLNKAAKGVDFKSLNTDLAGVKGAYDKSEESFKKIEEYGDKIALAWFKAKVNIADAIIAMVTAAEKEQKMNLYGANSYSEALGKSLGLPASTAKGGNTYKPITDTTVYKPDFNATALEKTNREVKAISDEQQKVLDKIQGQRTALEQNILTIQRQTKEVGVQKLLQNEILQAFEKGGKYDLIKDEKLKARILDLAKEYDIIKLTNDADEARGKAILAFLEQGRELQRQVIERKIAQQDTVDLEVKSLEAQTRRNEYEKELAGFSDLQREKALQYFDLKEKIIMLGADPMWSDAQIEQITKANQELIIAEDANRRAQNTFGAGWDKAYNNFKERATDSFSAGQSAFQSMTSNMESALDRFVSTGKISFNELANSIIADLIKIQLRASATTLFQEISGGIGGLFGSIFNTDGGVSASAGAYGINDNPYLNFTGYADGGMPPVGVPSLVGERGPELFVPRTSGTIIPNNQLSNMMGTQPQTVYNGPVIQQMNAIDTQSGIQFLTKNKDTIWAANQSAQRALPTSR